MPYRLMAVEEEKGNCEKEVDGEKVSVKGCDAEIFKPERNIKDILKLIRVQ